LSERGHPKGAVDKPVRAELIELARLKIGRCILKKATAYLSKESLWATLDRQEQGGAADPAGLRCHGRERQRLPQ
jgi:transposase-like protein